MKKAAATRLTILQKAFELIYVKGYQTTSIDDILATTQVTKGAFYYHFKNKDEMGIAILNELLRPGLTESFIQPLLNVEDPLDAIYGLMHNLLMENDFLKVEYGCPASNLTQEMAPWNTEFTQALLHITRDWETAMEAAIEKGREKGFVQQSVNARQLTLFVLSGYWGIRNLAKIENSKIPYRLYLKELKNYLDTLR